VSENKPWRDEELLRELYHQENMTQEQIADELGCGGGTVNRWIHNHDLEVNDMGSTNETIRDVDLYELYWSKKMTQSKIAERCGCSVALVSKQMNEAGVPTRRNMPIFYTRKQGGHEYVTTGGCGKDIQLHRLLAVAEYGVEAIKNKVVHHKNNIPWDNRAENIELMGWGEHTEHHMEKRDWSKVERDEKGLIVSW